VSDLQFAPLKFRSLAEYERFDRIKRESWTSWYAPPPASRRTAWRDYQRVNGAAAYYPEFYREVRAADGTQAAWLFASPTWWSGDPQALLTLKHHHRLPTNPYLLWAGAGTNLLRQVRIPQPFARLSARERKRRVSTGNAMMLIALHICPEFQGRGLSQQIMDVQRGLARQLGYSHLISPFRPSGYGGHKQASGKTHSQQTFAEYCEMTRQDGLPVDAWLRALTRCGMRPLRPEARSFVVTASIPVFEALQKSYRPDAWYEPVPGTFECGQTPTWYMDEGRGVVVSVEPNLWGEIPLD
jgi:GNAT superfamily N-acetyltransferase